ncbi:MAG: hypothetical protein QNK89_05280 [Lacinutrix sp.]|uniref:hypothetical protein n=1 Tax=Lacinutrix sp. TaxID=1937692 RepID=UPI00309DF57C
MILISKYLVPRGYTGITIYPFFFIKFKALKTDVVLINHEKIHLKQQLELLILSFYIFYVTEFLVKIFKYKNWEQAYRNISFEREAYKNQNDLNYLKSRPIWGFLNYIID